ncbi:MAG: IPExxxVDY family protein [Bacteroidetes bacterium]|nr:IPExxxVDY family protein [Bacteroidota bacterium]
MAKHVLHSGADDFDFSLLGITCSENQYFMVSALNDVLQINLALNSYEEFMLKGGKLFKFSLYSFSDEALHLEYFMIPNTSNFEEPNANTNANNDLFAGLDVNESVRLIKELPKTDYFLIVKGEEYYTYTHKIIERIKTIPDIIQVQSIEPNDLASKNYLIF